MARINRYLMCEPSFFDVSYVINPWMQGNVRTTSLQRAEDQWRRVHDVIAGAADVELVGSRPGLPDMPFTANAGLVLDDTVVLSRFLHPERQEEEPHFERWFCDNGFAVLKLPASIAFEGAGDALLIASGRCSGWVTVTARVLRRCGIFNVGWRSRSCR